MQGPVSRDKVDERKSEVKRKLRERAVPASSIGRVFGFARLGASLAYGSMSDSVSRVSTWWIHIRMGVPLKYYVLVLLWIMPVQPLVCALLASQCTHAQAAPQPPSMPASHKSGGTPPFMSV